MCQCAVQQYWRCSFSGPLNAAETRQDNGKEYLTQGHSQTTEHLLSKNTNKTFDNTFLKISNQLQWQAMCTARWRWRKYHILSSTKPGQNIVYTSPRNRKLRLSNWHFTERQQFIFNCSRAELLHQNSFDQCTRLTRNVYSQFSCKLPHVKLIQQMWDGMMHQTTDDAALLN